MTHLSRSRRTAVAFLVAMTLAASFSVARIAAQGQIVAGPNRNIAGGPVKWADPAHPFLPGNALKEGDPYGQRQDEVSCAIDSRNSLNVMCAFNDYTPTELGSNDCETRDAWIGTGWSTDGGFTWHNALLAGYPQDQSAEGFASTLRGFSTGADPTIRAGKGGKMYLLGIAFNRPGVASCANPATGTAGGGVVFLQTYVNNNNIENNPRPFQPVGQPLILDQGNTGTVFQDKPWFAVGPDGSLHVAYATFVGGNKPISIIWYLTSKDGVNWSKSKLSEGDKISNGTMIVVHPFTGWVDIVWRRRQSAMSSQTDAIQFVRSKDGGKSFTSPTTIVSLPNLVRADGTLVSRPFDQGSAPFAFRNISDPAITTDNFGRTYVAWSERSEHSVNGILRRDALIKMAIGTPAGSNVNQVTWTTPFVVDPLPPTNTDLDRGQQLRPALWSANGQLMLTYMSTRDDGRVTTFTRNDTDDPGKPGGKIARYVESFIYKGDLPSHPFKMFNDFIFDVGPRPDLEFSDKDPFAQLSPILRRHTEDVMAMMLTPAPPGAPNILPSISGKTKVSRYAMVLKDGILQQGQFNVLGRPLHCSDANGVPQCAFAGDYDDVVGQAWKADGNGNIVPNTDPATAVSFLVSWTDNRDLFPLSPTNNFSRVGPSCTDANATGTRNQNPYIARVGTGLFLFSYGNQRPLNTQFKRAFHVVFQNAVNATKTYQATIANTTLPGGSASWDQFSGKASLKFSIGPFSSASRALYAMSSDAAAPITVNVQELDTNGAVITGGLQATIVLNPDRSTPTLSPALPDPNVDGTNPAQAEVYIPDAAAPDAASPDAAANVVRTPDAAAPDAAAPDAASPDAAAVPPQYPDAAAPDAAAPDAAALPTMTPDAASPDAASVPPNGVITDTIYQFTNKSNVAAAFGVKTFTTQPLCSNCKLQILLMKPQETPTQRGCDPKNQDTAALVANIPSPDLVTDPNLLTFDPTDASVKNLTLAVPPGGQLSLIVRLYDPDRTDNLEFVDSSGRTHSIDPTFNPATDLVPVAIAQSVDTNCTGNCSGGNTSIPLIITTTSLFDGVLGRPYSQTVAAFGGNGSYTWTATGLPAGLGINSTTGEVSGTPSGSPGTFSVTFHVQDSSNPVRTATKALNIRIAAPLLINQTVPDGILGQPYSEQLTASGGIGTRTWSTASNLAAFGLSLSSAGVLSGVPSSAGTFNFDVTVVDETNPQQSDTKTLSINILAPDLIVESFTHTPASPTTVDQMTFTAVVKNIGNAPAPASKLLFKIGGETPGATGTLVDVPALAANGGSATLQRTMVLDTPQGYINTAIADCSSVVINDGYFCTSGVAESNEANNSATDTFVVSWAGQLNTDFVSAGFGGMRGDGTGSIQVAGVSGTVKLAMLYWHGPTNSTNPSANSTVTFAGSTIVGANIGFAQDNNWGFTNSQAYRANVTSLVTGNGNYALSNFLKTDADVNGVSLLVFYDDGNANNNVDVYIHDGNDSNIAFGNDPADWSDVLAGVKYSSGTAKLQLHVGDGQGLLDASVVLNNVETVAAGPIFQGLSVPNGPNPGNPQPGAGSGGLWDILSWDIPSGVLASGTNTVTLTSGTDQDALSLVVMIVIVPHVP